ncbi:hyaluronidase-2 [Astyanax mexicanus]|uniref:Hyaluronidase n=1 Tax=Astyanax mexicanus TaxID=7994 RepID=A0A8B9HP90_ASTMX|nr:hyaluronidase-2 [Astyanax mexicanus]XP_007234511.3 hyaluronidase-2 [Astyanax mexicanus]KAG9260691.1 hyaluronidase-2-like [Astyanax mexicanus]
MGAIPLSLSLFLRLLCLTILLWTSGNGQELKSTRWPLYSQKPLLLAWNAPTEDCVPRHGIRLQLDQFQIVASPNEGFVRQNLTIFYKERMGLYPYYKQDGSPVNGGLPQGASLTEHLGKMPDAIKKYIKEPTAKGLAVLDWEEWRPLWIRNWDAKNIYRNKSRLLISQKNPNWTPDQVAKVAQQEFELSARRFMLETLRYAKNLRPQQLWGFYLFPDCYNHNYRGNLDNYTGRCPDVEVTRNDQLMWLWTESTALYPSIYIGQVLKNRAIGRQFVRNRVREGMRLASVGNGTARPVFVYSRPTYTNELTLLTEMDLVSTIGESVSLGAAGIILWGDSAYASSIASCSSLSNYLENSLGRYLLNVSSAAEQCSRFLCGFRGRCLRRHPDTDTYLHLSTSTHRLELQDGRLVVRGTMGPDEQAKLREDFQCQCYTGYAGEGCTQRVAGSGVGSVWTVQHSCLWVVLVLTLILGFLQ